MAQLPNYSADIVIDFTATSPSAASTVAQTGINGLARFDAIAIEASLVGATGGTLDVYLQVSHDFNPTSAIGTWVDYVHFAQLSAGAAAVSYRVDPAITNSITTVGTGTTPALAAAICAGGFWGDAMRVLFVAGASTSAGASQTIKVIGKQRNVRP